MHVSLAPSKSRITFDPHLALLCESRWRTVDVPLAILRFVEQCEADSPSSAMKDATDSLLMKYSEGRHLITEPVSLARMCDLMAVELVRNSHQVRSCGRNPFDVQRRAGHTGRVFFKGLKATISIPQNIDSRTARISIAHELGHLLIHSRAKGYDTATLRLRSSAAEESLAEYCARLLLIPNSLFSSPPVGENLARYAFNQRFVMNVTLHSAVTRFGDPDVAPAGVRGAILWQLNPAVATTEPISARLTPRWHLCPGAFVPIGKSKARDGSLIAGLAESNVEGGNSKIEQVRIGTFGGTFLVDAYAWNYVQDGSRLVLSVFREPTG